MQQAPRPKLPIKFRMIGGRVVPLRPKDVNKENGKRQKKVVKSVKKRHTTQKPQQHSTAIPRIVFKRDPKTETVFASSSDGKLVHEISTTQKSLAYMFRDIGDENQLIDACSWTDPVTNTRQPGVDIDYITREVLDLQEEGSPKFLAVAARNGKFLGFGIGYVVRKNKLYESLDLQLVYGLGETVLFVDLVCGNNTPADRAISRELVRTIAEYALYYVEASYAKPDVVGLLAATPALTDKVYTKSWQFIWRGQEPDEGLDYLERDIHAVVTDFPTQMTMK